MISYRNLKNHLLKAVSLSKVHARQGLVLVQRIANGKTGTYLVHKWVRPDQVSGSDKVIAGHHNLQQGHPQRPAQVRSFGSTAPLSQTVKDATTALFQKCNNDANVFYGVLQNLGITWTRVLNRPGTDLMRAKMALNNAQVNGLDLSAIPSKLLGINNPAPQTTAPAPSPAPQTTAPVAQSTVLPPKATKSTSASKAIATQFCNSFANRQDFYDALSRMGIVWATNAHAGINFMRAKEALSLHIENGFDVNSAWNAIQSISATFQSSTPPASPTTSQTLAPATQSVPKVATTPSPAPKAASSKSTSQAAPPVDKSLLDIPKNATPTQIELIKHINNMTDYKTIRKCTIMGMVPEDDVAADYITETLLTNLKDWVTSSIPNMKYRPDSVAKKFIKDMAEIGEIVTGTTQQQSILTNSGHLVDILDVTGCKKDVVSNGLHHMFRKFNMSMLVSPASYVRPAGSTAPAPYSVADLISSANTSYCDYVTDQAFEDGTQGKTNLGYTGYNSEEYQKRYSTNKEGFVRLLQKIKADNSQDTEIAAEVDSMIADYNKAMKLVNYNPSFLKEALNQQIGNPNLRYVSRYFGNSIEPEACYGIDRLKLTLDGANAQADAIIAVLQAKGYSVNEIADSVDIYYNDDLSNYRIKKASDPSHMYKRIDIVAEAAQHGIDLSKYGSTTTSSVLQYTLTKLQKQAGLPDDDPQVQSWYKLGAFGREKIRSWVANAEKYSSLTATKQDELRNIVNHMMGTDSLTPSRTKSVIMANLLMATMYNNVTEDIVDRLDFNSKSQLNSGGQDYTGNFDFYAPHRLIYSNLRKKNALNTSMAPTYTAQQLSDKIKSQLDSTPTYSADYLGKLQTHYVNQATASGLSGTTADIISVAVEDKLGDMNLVAGLDPLLNSPIKDVVYKTTSSVLSHIPKMAQDPKFQSKIDKKLNYIPYDFSTSTQPKLKSAPKANSQNPNVVTDDQLKSARAKLLKAATLSLATESEQVSDKMRKDLNQNRFDYKAGEKTPDGKVFSGPFHRSAIQNRRCAMYNSRFFAVHNSVWEDRFKQKQAELKAKYPNDPKMWTPLDLFHGTSRASAGNILGRDAGWAMGSGASSFTKAGTMLGYGAYFGYKFGKSTVYVGNRDGGYANIKHWSQNSDGSPNPGDADGILVMANVMRGDTYDTDSHKSISSTPSSTSTDSQLDWEMVVRDNALIFPHHFVDVSCRCLGSDPISKDANGTIIGKNVRRDKDGNYLDKDGNITHDTHGKSVTMK